MKKFVVIIVFSLFIFSNVFSETALTAYELVQKGIHHSESGEFDKAIECFQKAIEINHKYARAYGEMGKTYESDDDYDKAIECYEKALELDPNDPFMKVYISSCRRKIEIMNPGIDALLNALYSDTETNPISDEAAEYLKTGRDFHEKGNLEKAIENYQKAIEIEPDYTEAYFVLGGTYGNMENFEKAIKYFRKAIELEPEIANIYYNLAIIYLQNNNLDEALKNLQKTIE